MTRQSSLFQQFYKSYLVMVINIHLLSYPSWWWGHDFPGAVFTDQERETITDRIKAKQ